MRLPQGDEVALVQNLSVTIGDLTLALASHGPECAFRVDPPFLNFRSERPPTASYGVHCGAAPQFPLGELVFETNLGWSLWRRAGKYTIRTRAPDLDAYQIGRFRPDFASGDIFVQPYDNRPALSLLPLGYPLGVVLAINLLAQGHGVMLHACAVDDNGKGLVFLGTGGSGKTTTARLWDGQDGARVLADDRVVIGLRDGKFWAYGTPWPGEGGMAVNGGVPVEHLFLLRHGRRNVVSPLSDSRAAALVLANAFPTYWDAAGMSFTLGFVADLCQSVRCSELGFVPTASAVDHVRCLS